jgi:L-iditol 2-dehydrogenase
MEVVGICGSDVHYLVSGKIGPFVVKGPMVIGLYLRSYVLYAYNRNPNLGHEASGTVLEVGKDVKNLKPGDRVAIEPGITCRLCPDCKNGNYHLCRDMIFCATPPVDGNLTRYYVHDADFCHKLPDNMDLEEGALMEPLSVGVHACKRAGVRVGSVVLVLGAGPIGLVSMLTAKAMGASKVIITDLVDHRLKKARELGADFTLRIHKSMTEDDIIKIIKTKLGQDPTVTLECTGAEQCVRVAVQVTRSGGVVILVGLGKFEMTVPLAGALVREVNIRGVFRYNNDYPIAIELVKTGKVNVKPLVTHHYTIEDTLKAFNTAKTGEGNPIKVLIHANPDWKP